MLYVDSEVGNFRGTVIFPFLPIPEISFPFPFPFPRERLIYSNSHGNPMGPMGIPMSCSPLTCSSDVLIPSPHSFIPCLNLPFLQILPTVAFLFFFRTDYMDSPDCLLMLVSISVFLLFSFSVSHFLVVGSCGRLS